MYHQYIGKVNGKDNGSQDFLFKNNILRIVHIIIRMKFCCGTMIFLIRLFEKVGSRKVTHVGITPQIETTTD